jgi:hypothetical protein
MTSSMLQKVKGITKEYPWLLSQQAPQISVPNFFTHLKNTHLVQVGINKTKILLHDPAYSFPTDFKTDAAIVWAHTLQALSHPLISNSLPHLNTTMLSNLSKLFITGKKQLMNDKMIPSFLLHSTPKVTIDKIHITYGPYPVPESYIAQDWLGFLLLKL